jgi:hypothetical protein
MSLKKGERDMPYHSPDNDQLSIDAVWLFVSVDNEGNEGVCGAPLMGPGTLVPLIAADEARLKSLIPVAQQMAQATPSALASRST